MSRCVKDISSFDTIIELSKSLYKWHDNKKWDIPKYITYYNHNDLIKIITNSMTADQLAGFLKIHEIISRCQSSIILLDSKPGTGKTHLTGLFALSIDPTNYKLIYTVYKTELAQNMGKISSLHSFTATKFTMGLFGVSYQQMFNKYNKNEHFDAFDVLIRILFIVKAINLTECRIPTFKILIVDEYTVLNPEVLVCICLFGKVHNKHVVFVGDRCQQNAINSSAHHPKMSNYFFLREIADETITIKQVVRCTDPVYNKKLGDFRDLIVRYGVGNTPQNPYIVYRLYEQFHDKFGREESFDATYMAAHHFRLTTRAKMYLAYLQSSDVTFWISKYYLRSEGSSVMESVPDSSQQKFSNILILVIGREYIFIRRQHRSMPYGRVELKEVTLKDGEPHSIKIQHKLTKEILVVTKEKIAPNEILEDYYSALTNRQNKISLYQFPLSPLYVCTYHNAQGLTLDSSIDMNITGASCESIYVGLSRIKLASQLNSIQVHNLDDLKYTHAMNDEYLYKMPFLSIREIVADATSTLEFETNKKENVRIKKALYENIQIPKQTSNIITVCNFIKEHHTYIRKMLPTFKLNEPKNIYEDNLTTYADGIADLKCLFESSPPKKKRKCAP